MVLNWVLEMAVPTCEFGEFRLEPANYALRRAGRAVRLEKMPFDLLVLLIGNRERVVTREEIRAALWGGEQVQDLDQSINTAVRKIRLALRDNLNEPRYVQTLVGRGYRFIAEVQVVGAGAAEAVAEAKVEVPAIPVGEALRRGRMAWRWLMVAGVIVLGVGAWRFTQGRRDPGLIAVLPFEDLNQDPARAYFSRGITEEVITQLGRAAPQGLDVIATSSIWRYRGKPVEPGRLAIELGAGYLLTGSVAHEGKAMRVTARVIRARDGVQLWAEAFNGNEDTALVLQQEVALSVARAMQDQLGGERAREVSRPPTLDGEAADLYLRGRFYWNQRTEASLQQAIQYFQETVNRAPGYAPAHAAMADCYAALVYGCYLAPSEGFSKARAALQQARRLSPESPEVHASEGYVNMYFDWDLEAAHRNLERAVAGNPNYASAYDWLGVLLTAKQDFPAARAALERGRRLDPGSLPIMTNLGFHLHYSGRNEEARARLAEVMRVDPNFPLARFWMGRVLNSQGDCTGALSELEAASKRLGDWQPVIAADGYIAGVCGEAARARADLRRMEKIGKTRFVTSYGLALIHAGLGEKEEALMWLRKAVEERSHWLVWIRMDPRFAALRGDARFEDLARKVFPGSGG